MPSDTIVLRRTMPCFSRRRVSSLACLFIAGFMILGLFPARSMHAEELPPIIKNTADCVLQCAEDHPGLGSEYDACVDECNEA